MSLTYRDPFQIRWIRPGENKIENILAYKLGLYLDIYARFGY